MNFACTLENDPRPVLENSLPNINITNYIERYPTAKNVLEIADS